MNERQWELYRLSVVEKWSDSPYKRAVSAAIEHKLMVLGQHTAVREEAKKDAGAANSRTGYTAASYPRKIRDGRPPIMTDNGQEKTFLATTPHIIDGRRRNESMWRYGLAVAAITGMLSLLASAQTPSKGNADKAAARAAQGYAPVTLWEHPDVRAIRVELKPMANRAIHQHDDVKFHLFIPVTGTLQITIGSDKPVDAPAGQAFYIKGGTPHGFRNLGSTPGTAIEIFVKNGASTASLDAAGALAASLQTSPPQH